MAFLTWGSLSERQALQGRGTTAQGQAVSRLSADQVHWQLFTFNTNWPCLERLACSQLGFQLILTSLTR